MIQLVSFTSAVFEAFTEAYQCFLVSVSIKKEAKAIKFSGIFKILCLQEKNIFLLKKKMQCFI